MLSKRTSLNFKIADSFLLLNDRRTTTKQSSDFASSSFLNEQSTGRAKHHKSPSMFLTGAKTNILPESLSSSPRHEPRFFRSSSVVDLKQGKAYDLPSEKRSLLPADYQLPKLGNDNPASELASSVRKNSEFTARQSFQLSLEEGSALGSNSANFRGQPKTDNKMSSHLPQTKAHKHRSHFSKYLDFLDAGTDRQELQKLRERLQKRDDFSMGASTAVNGQSLLSKYNASNGRSMSIRRPPQIVVSRSEAPSIDATPEQSPSCITGDQTYSRTAIIRKLSDNHSNLTPLYPSSFSKIDGLEHPKQIDRLVTQRPLPLKNYRGNDLSSKLSRGQKANKRHSQLNIQDNRTDTSSNHERSFIDTRAGIQYDISEADSPTLHKGPGSAHFRRLGFSTRNLPDNYYEITKPIDENLVKELAYNLSLLVSMNKNEKTTSDVIKKLAKDDRFLLGIVYAKYHRIFDYKERRLKKKLQHIRVIQEAMPPIDWKAEYPTVDTITYRKLKFFAEELDQYNIDKKKESVKGLEDFLIKSHLNIIDNRQNLLKKVKVNGSKFANIREGLQELHGTVDFSHLLYKDSLALVERMEDVFGQDKRLLARNRATALSLRHLVKNYSQCSEDITLAKRIIG